MKHIEKESDFNELIKGDLVIVDFFATWCGPCHMISPALEALEKEKSNLQVVKIDVDKHEKLAKEHGILSIPTLEIYKNSKLINKVIGYQSKEELEDLLK